MSRTYLVETYGCQMNVHDSERIAGLLDEAGHIPVIPGEQADIVVFNTCAVRENADNKLYGNLSFLAPIKKKNPAMQIAVGGCLAQKDQSNILKKAPYVDVVFGTHNVGSLPLLLERARIEEESQIEILESLEHFPSTLPARRFSAFTSWVSISVGCNNTCTFCIVPALRGVEKDRAAADVLKEMQMLADQGVIEITLLGQNVNAYGVEFGDRGAFAKLLRDAGKIQGLERVRFMSPHPRDFTDDVIEAMAQTENVMPHLHMPLQSGSDSILQSMRRSYRTDKYLGILERVRASIPQAMITTDIIVGLHEDLSSSSVCKGRPHMCLDEEGDSPRRRRGLLHWPRLLCKAFQSKRAARALELASRRQHLEPPRNIRPQQSLSPVPLRPSSLRLSHSIATPSYEDDWHP